MAGKRKRNGRVMAVPAGVCLGVGVSGLVTVLGAAVLAWLVSAERVGEASVGWGCMLIQVVSSAAGCLGAWGAIRHQRLMVAGLTAGGYYLLLLLMALAFGGGFTGMGTTACMVAIGGAVTQIPALFGSSSGARKRKIKPFR